MARKTRLISAKDVLAEHLEDQAFRAEWDRTALARAVALAVVKYRVKHKLTQTALGERLGLRQPHVARLELGEHNPSMEMLKRLARLLGLRFIVEVAPANLDKEARTVTLPPGVEVIEDVRTTDGSRVVVAASS